MKQDNKYERDKIYYPTKHFMEKWLRLDCVVFMVDEWHKHIERMNPEEEIITFVLVSNLPQQIDVMQGVVAAFIVGKPIFMEPPKFLFFDIKAMSGIEAFRLVYEIVKRDLIEKEEYEVLLKMPDVNFYINNELDD